MKPKDQAPPPQPTVNTQAPKIGDTKPHPTNPHITLTVTGFDVNGPVYRKLR